MTLESEAPKARLAGDGATRANLFVRYVSRFDDGEIIRWAFRGMLVGTIIVLGLDLRDLASANGWAMTSVETAPTTEPVLPPAVEVDSPEGVNDPRPFVTTDDGLLGQPMTFSLESGGRLKAEGTIQPGTAERFAAEIAARGEYVKTVSLNSPGGALDDAMAMARLVREHGLDTQIMDGALCASSCPLVLAGGKHRAVEQKAAVGVHQFYAASQTSAGPEQVMADAQATTARISRHLVSMDVDPELWLHALDTPPRALYYFTAEEMTRYRLATPIAKKAKK